MKNHPYFLGIIYSISAFTIWVFVDTTIKLATEEYLPPFEISGLLGLAGAIAITLYAIYKRNLRALIPKDIRTQTILGALAIGCSVLNAVALKHIPLTSFYAIIFTAPLMIALLAALFLHERLGWHNFIIIVVGFVGTLIAVNPFVEHSSGDWVGYAASLIQALCYSGNIVISRRLTQSESIESLVLFNSGVNALVGLGFAFIGGNIIFAAKPVTMLMASGALNMAAIALAYLSVKHAPASIASPFHYTQIITGALLGYLIWNDIPTLHLVLGVIVIVLSGLHFVMNTKTAKV